MEPQVRSNPGTGEGHPSQFPYKYGCLRCSGGDRRGRWRGAPGGRAPLEAWWMGLFCSARSDLSEGLCSSPLGHGQGTVSAGGCAELRPKPGNEDSSSTLSSYCATAETCCALKRTVAFRFPGLACT